MIKSVFRELITHISFSIKAYNWLSYMDVHFWLSLAVSKFVSEDRLPHLLFYGPPGTGKTSTILAVAKQIYSPKEFNSMVLEVWITALFFVEVPMHVFVSAT